MSLARRVRDYRFAKGWGPDELSSRASISRTALYQIESGKTELPRAATLQRIAVALGVSMEVLLEDIARPLEYDTMRSAGGQHRGLTLRHESRDPAGADVPRSPRVGSDPLSRPLAFSLAQQPDNRFESPVAGPPRETIDEPLDLLQKFRDLLDSPLGQGLARLVEDSHRALVATR